MCDPGGSGSSLASTDSLGRVGHQSVPSSVPYGGWGLGNIGGELWSVLYMSVTKFARFGITAIAPQRAAVYFRCFISLLVPLNSPGKLLLDVIGMQRDVFHGGLPLYRQPLQALAIRVQISARPMFVDFMSVRDDQCVAPSHQTRHFGRVVKAVAC